VPVFSPGGPPLDPVPTPCAGSTRFFRSPGFGEVYVERQLLDLAFLDRADGVMGLVDWGEHAARAKVLSHDDARRRSTAVQAANCTQSLRFRCEYVLAVGHTPAPTCHYRTTSRRQTRLASQSARCWRSRQSLMTPRYANGSKLSIPAARSNVSPIAPTPMNHVCSSTTPDPPRWKACTAVVVCGPNQPSAGPGSPAS